MKTKKMKTRLIDGKKAAAEIEKTLKQEIASFSKKPGLAVILVGDNPASLIYVTHKKKTAERIGIDAQIYHLSPVITQDALIAFIEELNQNASVHGIIVQLPLPIHINENAVLEAICPEKDVDGLHPQNLGRLFIGQPTLIPCTPLACLTLLKSVCKNLTGKTAVVSATGHAGLIRKSYVKKGAVLIDVGIIRLADKKITGDMAFDEMIGHAKAITPVPGGVGPMTVITLMQNLVTAYYQNEKNI